MEMPATHRGSSKQRVIRLGSAFSVHWDIDQKGNSQCTASVAKFDVREHSAAGCITLEQTTTLHQANDHIGAVSSFAGGSINIAGRRHME